MNEAPIPVTQSQSLIHLGQTLADASPLYNMAFRFDLHLELDPGRFAAAFETVIAANDAMRMVFAGAGAGLTQSEGVMPAFPSARDFSDAPDPEAAVAAWVAKRASRPIDLAVTTYDTCLVKLATDHWVWFFCQHHIATDAWSVGLLFKAVSSVYEGGAVPAVPQFATHACAEQSARGENGLKAAQDHWQAKAKDHPGQSAPYGATRDLSVSASRRVQIPFGAERSQALRDLAQTPPFRSLSPDLSIFALLATVYAAFLFRTTDDRQITLGAPSHNRATPDLKATMGLFVELFPLVIQIEEDDTFESLYQRVLAEVLHYLRHARPGASSVATAALYHAVLNYIPVVYGRFAGAKTRIAWLHSGAHDARHDIRLNVSDFSGSGVFTFEADLNTAVFDETMSDAVPDHLLSLFDALLCDTGQTLARVPLLPAPPALCGPVAPEAPGIHQAFAAQLAATPDAIAVQSPDGDLTYAALNARADAYAAAFKPRQPVLLFAPRSANLVAAMLGAVKAGAPFVPLASDTPHVRVQTIAAELATEIFDLDAPLPEQETQLLAQPNPDEVAHIYFTSGSTGKPKGVVVDQQNFSSYVHWAARSFGPDGPKSYALCSSIGFDLTITSIFVPLITGGRVVIYPDASHGSDLAILDALRDDQIDVFKLTPSHLALVLEAPHALSRIKTLVFGGETLTTELCNRALACLSPDLEIINVYGPTETVVGCMIHRYDPATDRTASVPIGKPGDGMRIHLLDQGMNPVPIGVTGEIYVEGRLARGYFGREDLTAERFITHKGARLYKSGDLARRDQMGRLHYLGRSDMQVKVGGIRIEPAEIEAALNAIPGITAAHVTTHMRALPKRATSPQSCSRCGITDDVPDTTLNAAGICSICEGFDGYKDKATAYFKTPEALKDLVATLPNRKTGAYDAIVLLSGGKDSTYALYRFAALTSNILTLTLDNGYLSDEAKANITRVTEDLGVDHRFLSTPAMNAIFADSLTRHSNVCHGCFKTLYTLALRVARDEGIPAIVTGLSRGQLFETWLSPKLFETRAPSTEELEDFVLDARKSYHKIDDAVAQHLKTGDVQDDRLLDQIAFIDIYRYIDVTVEEIYGFLSERAPWVRPGDTGRSTNCLINDAGIYVHLRREGYHNDALPYSWDVRMGHKTRAEAVDALNNTIDPARVQLILAKVGFDEPLTETRPQLVAYVTGDAPDEGLIRTALARSLPRAMMPAHIIPMDSLPLNSNGKVDKAALPPPDMHRPQAGLKYVPPEGDIETRLVQIFTAIIGTDRVGVTDNFYDLGGDSLAAIRIAMEAGDQGLAMAPGAVFEHQTIRALAASLTLVEATPDTPSGPLISLGDADLAALAKQLGQS